MKNLLRQPRSIIGATLWGALVAVIVFIALLITDFVVYLVRAEPGPARSITAIAVGNGYSIALEATPANALLAEYTQAITVFGGKPRQRKELGKIGIPMNTGGRVRIGVLVPREQTAQAVVLADRQHITRIDLPTQTVTDYPKAWKDPVFKPLGIISGESYPIQFIACEVWPLLSAAEQALIIRPEDKLHGFCDPS